MRFQTDPNIPGTEKLAVRSRFAPQNDEERLWTVSSQDLGASAGLAPPMCVFNVKGWTRSLTASLILLCAFECDDFMKAGGEMDVI